MIRRVELQDAKAITTIYNEYDWQKCKILNLGRRRDGNELKFCNLRQKEKPWNH